MLIKFNKRATRFSIVTCIAWSRGVVRRVWAPAVLSLQFKALGRMLRPSLLRPRLRDKTDFFLKNSQRFLEKNSEITPKRTNWIFQNREQIHKIESSLSPLKNQAHGHPIKSHSLIQKIIKSSSKNFLLIHEVLSWSNVKNGTRTKYLIGWLGYRTTKRFVII